MGRAFYDIDDYAAERFVNGFNKELDWYMSPRTITPRNIGESILEVRWRVIGV